MLLWSVASGAQHSILVVHFSDVEKDAMELNEVPKIPFLASLNFSIRHKCFTRPIHPRVERFAIVCIVNKQDHELVIPCSDPMIVQSLAILHRCHVTMRSGHADNDMGEPVYLLFIFALYNGSASNNQQSGWPEHTIPRRLGEAMCTRLGCATRGFPDLYTRGPPPRRDIVPCSA